MADSRSGVQGSLLQLQESLSAADRCSAAMASYQLIRGLGQECVLSTDPAVLGGYRPRPGWATLGLEARARFRVSELCWSLTAQRFSNCRYIEQ